MQKKSFDKPDETRTPPNTKIEVVTIGDNTLMRVTFAPGWKWSKDVKPTAGTDSCQTHHVICQLSGHLKTVMDDGTEEESGPGDVIEVPSGHDAWVIGDEPVVGIDIAGGATYAKPAS